MKSKKLTKWFLLLTIFISTSCAMYTSDTLPHLDGVKFNQLTSFQSTAIIILGVVLVLGILLFVFYKKASDRKKNN